MHSAQSNILTSYQSSSLSFLLYPQSLKAGVGAGLGAPGFSGVGASATYGDASSWLAANPASGPIAGSQIPMSRSSGHGCSIYIKGMPEDADKLWLYEKFSRFGGILSVRVLLDEVSGRCNGIGFVNYTDSEGARAAHETMNGVSMGERLLHVMVQSHGAGRNSGGSRLSNNSLTGGNAGGGSGGGGGAAGMAVNGLPGAGAYIPGGVSAALQQQQQQQQQPIDFINQQGSW
jgi:RNA recognition motif-containing protein